MASPSVTASADPARIVVHSVALPVVEEGGERLITFAMIDHVHCRPAGTASRNFREHRDRLVRGEDFHELTGDEIRRRSLEGVFAARTSKGIVLTESGYLMVVKAFTDDLAWQVQKKLVRTYFRVNRTDDAPSLTVPADYAAALRLAADSVEREARAQERVAELEPLSEALALLTDARGSLNLTEASKALGATRAHLIAIMQRHRWIYRRGGAAAWLGYSDKVDQGLLTHKVDTIELRGGAQQMVEQVRVTAKGVTKLALLIGGSNG